MKQQAMLRQAMRQSGQTCAQLASDMCISGRMLDQWLLPEASDDFLRIPENALRLLANRHGLRKSSDLSMPYDSSNPAMSDDVLILSVLRRAYFPDLVRICAEYSLATVQLHLNPMLALVPNSERVILSRVLRRMLRSIEIALIEKGSGRTAT